MQYPTGSGMKSGELVAAKLVGVNRQARGVEGAFSDCRNIMPDKYPCISTYAGYEDVITEYTNIQCAIAPMYGATKFCGVADGKFYWDGEEIGNLSSSSNEVRMICYSGKVYIQESNDRGRILYICDLIKKELKRKDEENAKKPTEQYIFHDGGDCLGVGDGRAESVKQDFLEGYAAEEELVIYPIRGEEDEIMKRIEGQGELVAVEDNTAIYCKIEKIESKSSRDCTLENGEIERIWGNCFSILFLNKHGQQCEPGCEIGTHTARAVKVYGAKNLVPRAVTWFEMYKNRAWAGRIDGTAIIASAIWEPDNFFEFDGGSDDSIEIEIGTEGEFVGFKAYSDSLLCFKRNSITVLYGDTPDNFSIGKEIKGTGCIDIRSCEIIDGVLYFLGPDGFYSYSGGWPQLISNDLNTRYISCISFSFEGKYYAEGLREDGEKEIAVYDTRRGMWLLEEAQGIRGVYYKDSDVYIVTENAVRRRKASKEYEACGDEWYFESMDLYEGIFEKKGISKLFIRAKLSQGAEMTVLTRDEDGELTEHKSFTGDGRIKTYRVPVKFSNKEAYRYRIEGKGPAVIYEVARTIALGGRKIYEE